VALAESVISTGLVSDKVITSDDLEAAKSKHDEHFDPVNIISVWAWAGIAQNTRQIANTAKPTILIRI
jgi:hypothetical protein